MYPGERTRGKILFEIPESATGLKIQYDFGDFFTGVKLATWKIVFNTESLYSISKVKNKSSEVTKEIYKPPKIIIHLQKSTYKAGEYFEATYDVYNVIHNGKYDIHIYEELFDPEGLQLWKNSYDVGRDCGFTSANFLHYKLNSPHLPSKSGTYTLAVTIKDYITNLKTTEKVKFKII